MKKLTEFDSWISLEKHANELRLSSQSEIKKINQLLKTPLVVHNKNLALDLNNQRITNTTIKLLCQLARELELSEKIKDLVQGNIVNFSEGNAALHTALRQTVANSIWLNNSNILDAIKISKQQIELIATKIRKLEWLGFSNQPITAIVNIGIGGSDLGFRFCINALSDYLSPLLSYHFISDADPLAFETTVKYLNPETTLFILVSKSFSTQETLYNARKAFSWIGGHPKQHRHFIAITANPHNIKEFNIKTILPMWSWVGGRYSLCSAANLITAIGVGYENFIQLLTGADVMDQHFLSADFSISLPILLALVGIWNNNFLHIHNLLILVYTQKLNSFVNYLQQLEMESNGKSFTNNGIAVNYATAPIIWGGLGNQIQHSYFQLLCQGTHKIATAFISLNTNRSELINQSLYIKKTVLSNGIHDPKHPNSYIPGNMPSNEIRLTDCTPFTIGQLISLYEHKVFTQGVIWDINPFDQPAIDISKKHLSKLTT